MVHEKNAIGACDKWTLLQWKLPKQNDDLSFVNARKQFLDNWLMNIVLFFEGNSQININCQVNVQRTGKTLRNDLKHINEHKKQDMII